MNIRTSQPMLPAAKHGPPTSAPLPLNWQSSLANHRLIQNLSGGGVGIAAEAPLPAFLAARKLQLPHLGGARGNSRVVATVIGDSIPAAVHEEVK